MGILSDIHGQPNSAVGGPIRPKFELVRAVMHVIITCKYEKDQKKNSQEKVETLFFPTITLSVTMETSGWIWPNFKLIQALMNIIITCKYEKDPIKNSAFEKKWRHNFSHYDGPRGVANLDPRGMIGRFYVEYHLTLLHTKYISFQPCGFREEDF